MAIDSDYMIKVSACHVFLFNFSLLASNRLQYRDPWILRVNAVVYLVVLTRQRCRRLQHKILEEEGMGETHHKAQEVLEELAHTTTRFTRQGKKGNNAH